ncbi:MAG: GNAT family N-acetyltransferase [Methanosarcinales archaeon]
MIKYSTEKNHPINWNEAINVFLRAPLGKYKREPDKLKRAFLASYAVIYVFDSDKLIGLGRALCDGEYQAAIYDVVLLPEYQREGIGKKIMGKLCEQIPVENIILYASVVSTSKCQIIRCIDSIFVYIIWLTRH